MPGKTKHLVVVGGGAAGFFCVVNAARLNPGLQVTIIEKGSKVLQKVKVSGGGRCNVTHACFEQSAMLKNYPRGQKLLKKSFRHFFTTDTIEWFGQRGVMLKTEPDGRMFPESNSSQTIMDCLLHEANKYHVELRLNFDVAQMHREADQWIITERGGRTIAADFVCIACGGFPKADMFQWIVKATQHNIVAPVPSLFTFNCPGHSITSLMGISSRALVKIAGLKYESTGPLLITHWGISGPAVLRLSAFAARDLAERQYDFKVIINWLPDYNETSLREMMIGFRNSNGATKLENTPWLDLPARLKAWLLQDAGIDGQTRWADLKAAQQNQLAKTLCSFELHARGKTTFKEEFVSAGGIDLAEVDADTMQSRKAPALWFAGEILDVDGVTGGFNFQHAWTSGFVVANSIAAQSAEAL